MNWSNMPHAICKMWYFAYFKLQVKVGSEIHQDWRSEQVLGEFSAKLCFSAHFNYPFQWYVWSYVRIRHYTGVSKRFSLKDTVFEPSKSRSSLPHKLAFADEITGSPSAKAAAYLLHEPQLLCDTLCNKDQVAVMINICFINPSHTYYAACASHKYCLLSTSTFSSKDAWESSATLLVPEIAHG